jgi:lysozyme
MTTAPQPKKRLSREGLELIKSFEGLRRRAARLPGGRFVLGYGHIRSAREGAEVTPADAEDLLRYDLLPIEAAINDWALAPLNQNQFDALVSFAFNIGLSTFRRSEVLRRINEGDLVRAAAAMDAWRRIDLEGQPIIVDALVRRRAVEKALYLTPVEGQVAAPSSVLKPQVDALAAELMPSSRPEVLDTPLDGDLATVSRLEPEPEPELEPTLAEPDPFLDEARQYAPLLVDQDRPDPAPELRPDSPSEADEEVEPDTAFGAAAEPELATTESITPPSDSASDGAAEQEAAAEIEPDTDTDTDTATEAEADDVPSWSAEAGAGSVEEEDEPESGELEFEPESSVEFEPEVSSEAEPDGEDEGEAPAVPEYEPADADAEAEFAAEAPEEAVSDEATGEDAATDSASGDVAPRPLQDYVFDHDEEEDEGLSAAQAAAAAVAARLSEILAQDLNPNFDDEEEDDAAALTEDPEADTADGAFLQAPPSPPEEAGEPSAFAELDQDAILRFAAETPRTEVAFEPAAELQPFPEDLPLPEVIEPEEQAEFDSAYAVDPDVESAMAAEGEAWDQRSGALPSGGDPDALAEPLEEESRAGLLITLGLLGLTLIIAALVSFARTPAPDADPGQSGWTMLLGSLGVLLVCGALWIVLAPEEEAEEGSEQEETPPQA